MACAIRGVHFTKALRPIKATTFTVGRELGHGGDTLVRTVYGHLGNVRHRSAVVEYRVEQHAASLRDDRLAVLRSVAG